MCQERSIVEMSCNNYHVMSKNFRGHLPLSSLQLCRFKSTYDTYVASGMHVKSKVGLLYTGFLFCLGVPHATQKEAVYDTHHREDIIN